MVTDLLQLHHRRQHQAPAFDARLAFLDPGHHLVQHRLVEGGLLSGDVAKDLHLDLVGKVGDDRPVRLEPAEDERLGRLLEPGGDLLIAVSLDRDRDPAPEVGGGTKQARIQEVHDRPELGEPVLDRGAGESHPAGCLEAAHRLGLLGGGVLDVLGLV